jgi:hypothetical protein
MNMDAITQFGSSALPVLSHCVGPTRNQCRAALRFPHFGGGVKAESILLQREKQDDAKSPTDLEAGV